MFRNSTIALILVIMALPGAAPAQRVTGKHAQVELLAHEDRVQQTLWFGVHFILEPGWHIYWVNPGDSGQPPVFHWQLPPALAAGEIQWPRPQRMQSSSQIADYGYHDEALLMVPIRAAGSALVPDKEPVTVEAKWLICREVCLTDHAQLHLTLPVRSDPATAAVFDRAAKLLPKPMPPNWKATAEVLRDDVIIVVRSAKPLGHVEFFPLDAGVIDNAAPQGIASTPQGVKITLKKSDLLVKPLTHLRGVLALAGSDAYRIDAPVTKP